MKKRVLILALLVISLMSMPQGLAAEWPQVLGDTLQSTFTGNTLNPTSELDIDETRVERRSRFQRLRERILQRWRQIVQRRKPLATCTDGIKNQGESDVDCGGSCEPCTAGKACSISTDCKTGSCMDGICKQEPDSSGSIAELLASSLVDDPSDSPQTTPTKRCDGNHLPDLVAGQDCWVHSDACFVCYPRK